MKRSEVLIENLKEFLKLLVKIAAAVAVSAVLSPASVRGGVGWEVLCLLPLVFYMVGYSLMLLGLLHAARMFAPRVYGLCRRCWSILCLCSFLSAVMFAVVLSDRLPPSWLAGAAMYWLHCEVLSIKVLSRKEINSL